ncbi:MAG: hypothetical protein MR452_00255, partial [Faecalibacterium prausnitzii]|nr:hypothetical protein [Faecalibacterium prausnitzii]
YNIPQSYPIFQVVIEKLLILFCKYLYFSGCCSSLLWGKREPEILLALVARGMFFFRSNGLRSARARGRAGFFFKLVLALVARGWFFLLVKWLCAPRGPETELVFSLSWFSRWWHGAVFSFGQMALRSARARGRAGFFFKLVLALVARGCFILSVKGLALRAGQRQGGVFRIPPPYLWTPLSPQRVKGCSPLTIPKR